MKFPLSVLAASLVGAVAWGALIGAQPPPLRPALQVVPAASRQANALADFLIRDADAYRLAPGPVEEALFYTHLSPRTRILVAMRWRAEHPQP